MGEIVESFDFVILRYSRTLFSCFYAELNPTFFFFYSFATRTHTYARAQFYFDGAFDRAAKLRENNVPSGSIKFTPLVYNDAIRANYQKTDCVKSNATCLVTRHRPFPLLSFPFRQELGILLTHITRPLFLSFSSLAFEKSMRARVCVCARARTRQMETHCHAFISSSRDGE